MLHLAAPTSEADVEMALTLLLVAVYELVRELRPALVPPFRALALDVSIYDGLLPSQHHLDDASDASQVAQEVRSAHDQARELARWDHRGNRTPHDDQYTRHGEQPRRQL